MAPGFSQADFESAGRGWCEEGCAVEEGFGALGYEGEGVGGGGEGGWEAGVCWWLCSCGHFGWLFWRLVVVESRSEFGISGVGLGRAERYRLIDPTTGVIHPTYAVTYIYT